MAGTGSTPSPAGKRDVDFQLNMIPFIDLLSVMISFLLFTAIWTQIAKIDVQQAPESAPAVDAAPQVESLELAVLIKASGYAVSTRAGTLKEIAGFDAAVLGETLASVRAQHPENDAVTLTSEDTVPYRELIAVMDACLKSSLTAISVAGI
jgi:biopolymer transport protein TolR